MFVRLNLLVLTRSPFLASLSVLKTFSVLAMSVKNYVWIKVCLVQEVRRSVFTT